MSTVEPRRIGYGVDVDGDRVRSATPARAIADGVAKAGRAVVGTVGIRRRCVDQTAEIGGSDDGVAAEDAAIEAEATQQR